MVQNDIKIALCCIVKDENEYIDEWVNHHKNIGFDQIIIYDNNSKNPILTENVIVNNWNDEKFRCQSRAYIDCCNKYSDFDYIAFFDIDEFYMSKTMDIKKDLEYLNYPDGLGIYWRIYGKSKPYFINRRPYTDYIEYKEWDHIKSILNPKKVLDFPDPHFAKLVDNSIYI